MGITTAELLQPVPDTGRNIMDEFRRWGYLQAKLDPLRQMLVTRNAASFCSRLLRRRRFDYLDCPVGAHVFERLHNAAGPGDDHLSCHRVRPESEVDRAQAG